MKRPVASPLLAVNGQVREVPRYGSGVCPVPKNLGHHFKHFRKTVAKNDLGGPRCRGDLVAYLVVPPLHDGRYQVDEALGGKILRHGASRLASPNNVD